MALLSLMNPLAEEQKKPPWAKQFRNQSTGLDASSQNVDLGMLLNQTQPQGPSLSPQAVTAPEAGYYGMLPPVDGGFGVPEAPEDLPPVGGALDMGETYPASYGGGGLSSLPTGQNPYPQQVSRPAVSGSQGKVNEKKNFLNLVGPENVFLRGAQGLEDGGILGLIGQILNR